MSNKYNGAKYIGYIKNFKEVNQDYFSYQVLFYEKGENKKLYSPNINLKKRNNQEEEMLLQRYNDSDRLALVYVDLDFNPKYPQHIIIKEIKGKKRRTKGGEKFPEEIKNLLSLDGDVLL